MVAKKCGAPPSEDEVSSTRPDCVAAVRAKSRARNEHYADSHARRVRVLNINAVMGVVVCVSFVALGLWAGPGAKPTMAVNLTAAAIFATVPWLHRFGELVAPLTFIATAYIAIFVICWDLGTGLGGQFYLLTIASLVVLQFGVRANPTPREHQIVWRATNRSLSGAADIADSTQT